MRRGGCSQAGKDILAQNAVVLRYAAHFVLIQRAQKNASFSGINIYVLAPLHIVLINGFGQVKIVNPMGNQIAPCGQMKGVVVPFEECGLTGIDLQAINQITVVPGL